MMECLMTSYGMKRGGIGQTTVVKEERKDCRGGLSSEQENDAVNVQRGL